MKDANLDRHHAARAAADRRRRAKPAGRTLVALDSVGAGVGEHVFFVRGREAAFPFYPAEPPTDAASSASSITGTWSNGPDQGSDVAELEPEPCMQIAASSAPSSSTQKNRKLEGAKLLLVQPLTLDGTAARRGAAGDRLGRRRRRRAGAGRDRRQGGRRRARPEGAPRSTRRSSASSTRSITGTTYERGACCARWSAKRSPGISAAARRTPRRAAAAAGARRSTPSHFRYALPTSGGPCLIEPRCRAITAATASRTGTETNPRSRSLSESDGPIRNVPNASSLTRRIPSRRLAHGSNPPATSICTTAVADSADELSARVARQARR